VGGGVVRRDLVCVSQLAVGDLGEVVAYGAVVAEAAVADQVAVVVHLGLRDRGRDVRELDQQAEPDIRPHGRGRRRGGRGTAERRNLPEQVELLLAAFLPAALRSCHGARTRLLLGGVGGHAKTGLQAQIARGGRAVDVHTGREQLVSTVRQARVLVEAGLWVLGDGVAVQRLEDGMELTTRPTDLKLGPVGVGEVNSRSWNGIGMVRLLGVGGRGRPRAPVGPALVLLVP
jgi:hypothetical protein